MTRSHQTRRDEPGSLPWRLATHAVLIPAAVITGVPIVWLLITSFKTPLAQAESIFLPIDAWGINFGELTLRTYTRLLGLGGEPSLGMMRAFTNSVFIASTVSVVSSILCAAAGYTLAKHVFPGRVFITRLVLLALIVPAPMLIAAQYDLLYHVGLLDTYTGLMLPLLAPAFGVYLFRQASIRSVPGELIEAARMDGAGELRIFFLIALPLMRPMLGAFILITFMATWNNFITPQVMIQSPDKLPLAVFIANLRSTMYQELGLIMAATVVSLLPVAIVFALMQREFVSGLTEGAVRG